VPLENTILALTWASRSSGGSLVLIDQAAQDRFSADLPRAGVGCGDSGSRAGVRDALADALMGTGGVVVLLVLGQDGAQVRLVKDQGPVEEFPRRRVPMRRSQVAFIRGVCTAVRTMVVPAAW
jgi:hypothetical protein